MSTQSTLADFEFIGRLGKGSFGEVFQVRRKVDGEQYVMKQIHLAGMSDKEQHDAVREVHIMASLDSPYVVRYFDSFLDEGLLCIVMELCDRGDLSRMIRKQKERLGTPLPEDRIWHIAIQIMIGVAYLHSQRVLHRDLKSANVFLCSNNRVKIGDLGVARVLGTETNFAKTVCGTPYYFSPELVEGFPYNEKSDIWALGCILYELCSLKHAFTANNQGALVMKIIKGTYPPLPDVYSPRMRSLVDTMLDRDTRRRPMAYELLADDWICARATELGFGEDLPRETLAIRAARVASSVCVERPLGVAGSASTGGAGGAGGSGAAVGAATDAMGRLVLGDPTGVVSASATVRIASGSGSSGSSGSPPGATGGAGAVAAPLIGTVRGLSSLKGAAMAAVAGGDLASIAAAAAAESAAAASAVTQEADEAALALYDRMAKRSDAETTYLPADSGSVAGATLRGTLRPGGLARTLRVAAAVAVGASGGAGGGGATSRSVAPPAVPHSAPTVVSAAGAGAAAGHGSLVARRVRGKRGAAAGAPAAARKMPLSAEAAAAAAAAADAAARTSSRGGSRASLTSPLAASASAARLPAASPPAAAAASTGASAGAPAVVAAAAPVADVVSKLMAAEVAALPDDVPRASTSRRAPSSGSSAGNSAVPSVSSAAAAHGINTAALAAAPKAVPGAQRPSLDMLKSVAAAAEGAAAAASASVSAGSSGAAAASAHDDLGAGEHDEHEHDHDHDDVESDPAAAELFSQRQEMVLRVQAILAQCLEELPAELAPRVTAAAERATSGAAAAALASGAGAAGAAGAAAVDDLADIDTRALSAPGNLALYRLQYSLGVLSDFDGRLCELGWEVLRR